MEIIILISWCLVGGVIGGLIGERKGARGDGIALGIILGPLGWLISLCGKDERRTCAFCAEPIRDAAKFCPHCGRQQPECKPQPSKAKVETWANSSKFSTADAWVLASIVVVCALAIGYAFLFNPTH